MPSLYSLFYHTQAHDDFLFFRPSSSAILASSSELTVSKAVLSYGRRYNSCSKVGLDHITFTKRRMRICWFCRFLCDGRNPWTAPLRWPHRILGTAACSSWRTRSQPTSCRSVPQLLGYLNGTLCTCSCSRDGIAGQSIDFVCEFGIVPFRNHLVVGLLAHLGNARHCSCYTIIITLNFK